MATPIAFECPDPHQPDPVDDVTLRTLEKSLVVALVSTLAANLRDGAVDGDVRAYVEYLHGLKCPPEHVVIRVKRLLLRATRGMHDRSEARAISEALVLRAIRIYFEQPPLPVAGA